MYANRVIVEVVGHKGSVAEYTKELGVGQSMIEIHAELWKRVGRMPTICTLSKGECRVVFQESRRTTDTLDSLKGLVSLAINGEWSYGVLH